MWIRVNQYCRLHHNFRLDKRSILSACSAQICFSRKFHISHIPPQYTYIRSPPTNQYIQPTFIWLAQPVTMCEILACRVQKSKSIEKTRLPRCMCLSVCVCIVMWSIRPSWTAWYIHDPNHHRRIEASPNSQTPTSNAIYSRLVCESSLFVFFIHSVSNPIQHSYSVQCAILAEPNNILEQEIE